MEIPLEGQLTDAELERLDEFLDGCAGGLAMDLEELDGFFAALVIGPELVPPSEFLPEVFAEDPSAPIFSSADEETEIMTLLLRHWNSISHTLADGDFYMPILLGDEDDPSRGQHWAEGFMMGVDMCRDGWSEITDNEQYSGCLIPILFLRHQNDPEMQLGPITQEKREQAIALMVTALPEAYRFFREEEAIMGEEPPQEPRTAPQKIGRNAPCPCGSGMKYKKCCGGQTVH